MFEWEVFINVLMINLIVFFCELYYFLILLEFVKGWLVLVLVWCLVVFIGEELYLIVIMLIEVFGEMVVCSVLIFVIDFDM